MYKLSKFTRYVLSFVTLKGYSDKTPSIIGYLKSCITDGYNELKSNLAQSSNEL